MKNKIKYSILSCLLCLICLFTTACGNKNEVPELTEKILKEICSEAMKENMYFDQINNMTFEEVETSEEDLNTLKGIFEEQVEYHSFNVTANISSMSMDAYVEYVCVTTFNNIDWQVSICYPVNENKWKYEPKEEVALKTIMNDLKKVNVGPYEAGYVGDEKLSTLTIVDRKNDTSINRQTISCSLQINNEYGHYIVNLDAIYYFKRGNWVIGDFDIPDPKEWTFTYNQGYEIKLPSNESIINKIITKKEFLTYAVNINNVADAELIYDGMIASKENVTCVYNYIVEYEKTGRVVYDINIVYPWLSYEWGDGEYKVSVSKQDLSKLKGSKYINGNQYLIVDDVIEYSDDLEFDNVESLSEFEKYSEFVKIKYFDGSDTYDLLCNCAIILRDNNYDMNILTVYKNNEFVKHFKEFDKIVLDITDSLSIDGVVFNKCQSSGLLFKEFVGKNASNISLKINNVYLKDGKEFIGINYKNGEENYDIEGPLDINGNTWTLKTKFGEKEVSIIIYNDNPVSIEIEDIILIENNIIVKPEDNIISNPTNTSETSGTDNTTETEKVEESKENEESSNNDSSNKSDSSEIDKSIENSNN